MKLSFVAFFAALLMQPAFGDFDCSICDELYNANPNIPTVASLLKGNGQGNGWDSTDDPNRGIRLIVRDFLSENPTFSKDLPRMECWNVRGVTYLTYVFWDVGNVEIPDLNCWDTQDATRMEQVFKGALSFNGSLNGWNTKKVTNMYAMFAHAEKFNQPLSSFDTGKVEYMDVMFRETYDFNQPMGHFDTSNVARVNYMFYYANKFNQDISSWNVNKVTNFEHMFDNARAYNQPLAEWDIGSIENGYALSYMFDGASEFNQCLAPWASKIPNPNDLSYLPTFMFKSSGCPVKQDPATETSTEWSDVWCTSTCSSPSPTGSPTPNPTLNPTSAPNPTSNPTPNPTPNPTSALGRFELSHQDSIGTIDQVEPVLKAGVLFQAGPKVTKEKLTVELYGMADKDDDATHKCSDGVPITDTNILTINDISLTTGIASFDLNLKRTTDAQKVTDGAKVDVCARISFEDSDLDVLTNLDTRFQIVRTYETEVGGMSFDFNIGDPSTNSIGKDEVTNVLVSAFFCYESKDPLETDNKEFTPGQDVRVCLQPTQDNDSNFEYAITTIKDVKCSVSEDSSFDIEFGGRNEIDSEPNDEGILSFVFVLMDSLLVNLDESRELDCKGTAVLSSTRSGSRELEFSFDNNQNRFLQTTSSEDVDFGITLTIAEDGSGGVTIGTTFVPMAMALLGAFFMAHF